jgi:hypothetical protein
VSNIGLALILTKKLNQSRRETALAIAAAKIKLGRNEAPALTFFAKEATSLACTRENAGARNSGAR